MELKIGDQFEDFDEFESRFKAFCAQQSVHFVIADSKTVQSANKALSSTAKPYTYCRMTTTSVDISFAAEHFHLPCLIQPRNFALPLHVFARRL